MNKSYTSIGIGLLSLVSIFGCENQNKRENDNTDKKIVVVDYTLPKNYKPEQKKKREYKKYLIKDKKGWEYELKLEADENTKWDEDKANKALKVAEYFIKNNNQIPVISEHFLGVDTEIDNDDMTKNYKIAITVQEEQDIGFYSGARDVLGITVTTFEAIGCTLLEKEKISLTDDGLDGRVNYGAIVEQIKNEHGEVKKHTKVFSRKEGLEHKDIYQKLYESALDELIKQLENK